VIARERSYYERSAELGEIPTPTVIVWMVEKGVD